MHFCEKSVTKYGNGKQLIPTFSPNEIYQYSDTMLKHLPKDSLKKIQKILLYDNTAVYYNKTTMDRRTQNSNTANDLTDLNTKERLQKFKNQLKNEYVYRIPLRYFTDLGKINFPLKIDFRIKCYLETDMIKLFESKEKLTTVAAPRRSNYLYKSALYTVRAFLAGQEF